MLGIAGTVLALAVPPLASAHAVEIDSCLGGSYWIPAGETVTMSYEACTAAADSDIVVDEHVSRYESYETGVGEYLDLGSWDPTTYINAFTMPSLAPLAFVYGFGTQYDAVLPVWASQLFFVCGQDAGPVVQAATDEGMLDYQQRYDAFPKVDLCSSGAAPAAVHQAIGLPADGSCATVEQPELNWGGAASGGWSRSWEAWANEGSGGEVCQRTLVWSARGWTVEGSSPVVR